MSEQMENLTETIEQDEDQGYKPRNKVVAAKEGFYDRMKLSVRQVDFFIGGCILLMVVIIAIGLFN